MKSRVDDSLDSFQEGYTRLISYGTSEEVDLILDRNGRIFLEVEGTQKLVDTIKDNVLTASMTLREKDGLVLSDRIWRITEESKLEISSRIQQGILLGESHTKVSRDVKQYVVNSGGLRYKAERLVLTEMAKIYKLANESAVEQMRLNSRYMWFEKWELSPRHPRPDVCTGEGTLINTKNGPKNIEDIKTGDEVLTHKGRYRKVTKLYRTQVQNAELRKLTFQSEKNRIHEVIVTPNHPFLIDEEWIPAGDLKKGFVGVSLPESLCEQENQFLSDSVYKER